MMRFSRDHFLLLLVAAIWGSTFVAQRQAMTTMEPFSFNMARFALAASFLLPMWWWYERPWGRVPLRRWIRASTITGTLLFGGFALQQIGLLETTASNAAFITASYIVFVPLFGLLQGIRPPKPFWYALSACILGLYLLSTQGGLKIHRGDAFELAGSFFWAAHVIALSRYGRHLSPIGLTAGQFLVATLLSAPVALFWERPTIEDVTATLGPILWAGILSSALAFTLQVVALRTVRPTHAVLILSLESVFAALAGALWLGETLSARQWLGAAILLMGIFLAQWHETSREEALKRAETRIPH
ncbi:DMT family transporter [Tepidiphilus sp. J10]|uniref:DMT family transporter n=1 Tax=Tepidiphilus sp. J10 TaxID=2502185 RepID=UPI00115C7E6B|nr:DMT family transporter [Tepidiphilus sp. J10]MDD3433516.1 DMT family transporter [Tepidiphilus sp.]MDD3433699.1 DMT family transporter [Tepidiphilus sp.]